MAHRRGRPRATCSVDDLSIPASTGWSNETILCDARWRDGTGLVRRELVVRIAPSEYSVFPDDTFVAQYQIMRTLTERTDVPIAPVHWLERSTDWFGSPFWIMDRVAGDVPTDVPSYASSGWLHEAPAADQERAWWSGIEAMAALHRVDPEQLDLSALDRPTDPLAAQLDLYERFLTWAEEGEPHRVARQALDLLRRTAPDAPPEGPVLTWGDARLSNLIYRDFEVVAVLDWEMASICDPLLDLGWWLFADDALTRGSRLRAAARIPLEGGHGRAMVGADRAIDRRARLLRAPGRPALHRHHVAHGQAAPRHRARSTGVRVRQPRQPGPRGPARSPGWGAVLVVPGKHLDFSA